MARLDRDVARWDLLLSPNPASTPRLRKAFSYDGPVAETGYPRNDVLLAGDAAAHRRAVRDALGLDQDARVALYAPTWRDTEVFGERPRADWGTELAEVAAASDDLTWLVRAHNLVPSTTRWAGGGSVVDVSTYPDVADLYLAADLLVTDYSSAMFDFANTGKPMIFFAYDLDAFRDNIRGFYFDLLPEAPGPVVTSATELLDVLQADPSAQPAYADAYAAFRTNYCCLEDGKATDRVVELLATALR